MLARIITGICLALLAVPIFIFSDTAMLVIAIVLLSAIGVFEMLRCLGLNKSCYIAIPSYVVALIVPMLTRFGSKSLDDALLYLYIVYILACTMLSRGKILFADAAKTIVSTVYIVCGFSCLIAIRDLPNGLFSLMMVMVIAFATDIFAYFSGMFFGKHKLIPDVSPKKTVEGAIGGTFISAATFVGCAIVYTKLYEVSDPHVLLLCICGVGLSAVSQIGDLIASFIKREHNIKDYGYLFPGHGGVLDRFDSVIAVAPIMYLLISNLELFV